MTDLVIWNRARQSIVEAKSIDEVKAIKDKAEAMRAYAKQIGESLDVQNSICEIKLRAERRMGQMLKETELQNGGDAMKKKARSQDVTELPPSLSDFGIEKHESSRWQKIAELSEETFEQIITETKEEEKELTESLLLNTQRKIDRAIKIEEQIKNINQENLQQPQGKFDVIVVDPPWKVDFDYSPDHYMGRTANPYPEMSVDEIKAINLPAKDDSVLWLWTTHSQIWSAIDILRHWGYTYKCILVWDKEKMGIGKWLRKQCEFCLLGIKGRPVWTATDFRDIISEQKTTHSTKPESFYDLVDKYCVGRKLDYFARKRREGWEVYGDEVNFQDGEM